MPLPFIPLLLASSMSSYMTAAGQAKHAQGIAAFNQAQAIKSLGLSYQAINQRVQEEATRAGKTIASVRADSLRARGHVRAAAASSGVKGRSVEDVIDDFSRQEGNRVEAALISEEFVRANAEREKAGAEITTSSKLASSIPPEGPSLFNAALSAFADISIAQAKIDGAQDDGIP
jgi:hypothetical protein